MAKQTKTENTDKGYTYNKALEGCTIGAKRVITISEKTSQKDLKMLHEAGVKGIIKIN